jgi:hypothetical protein
LYIVDESTFSASKEVWWLYKKRGFYVISYSSKRPNT